LDQKVGDKILEGKWSKRGEDSKNSVLEAAQKKDEYEFGVRELHTKDKEEERRQRHGDN